MENIRFILEISEHLSRSGEYITVGDCIYHDLGDNRAKTFCKSDCVVIEIINRRSGIVDRVELPFANYFTPKQCSPGAPKWHQHIDNGCWHFSRQYAHVLPTRYDYENIAYAMNDYMDLFDSPKNEED